MQNELAPNVREIEFRDETFLEQTFIAPLGGADVIRLTRQKKETTHRWRFPFVISAVIGFVILVMVPLSLAPDEQLLQVLGDGVVRARRHDYLTERRYAGLFCENRFYRR